MNIKHLANALLFLALLMAAVIPPAQAEQKDALDPGRYYAPLAVMPFRLADRYWNYDWNATSELKTACVIGKLAYQQAICP